MTIDLNITVKVQVPDNFSDEIVEQIQGMFFNAQTSINVTSMEDEEEVVLTKSPDGKLSVMHSKQLEDRE